MLIIYTNFLCIAHNPSFQTILLIHSLLYQILAKNKQVKINKIQNK